MPGSATTTVVGNIATTTIEPGGNLALGCRVDLTTDPSGRIVHLRLSDSIGAWQIPRCGRDIRNYRKLGRGACDVRDRKDIIDITSVAQLSVPSGQWSPGLCEDGP